MYELLKKLARNNTGLDYIHAFFTIAEMYDSMGNKWLHAYVRKYGLINKVKDMQFNIFFFFFCLRIQHVSLREETQHSCIKCCMDYLVIIVDFLNNRILSCVEICDILAEHLAINKGEYERRCKSSKKRVPTWATEIAKELLLCTHQS